MLYTSCKNQTKRKQEYLSNYFSISFLNCGKLGSFIFLAAQRLELHFISLKNQSLFAFSNFKGLCRAFIKIYCMKFILRLKSAETSNESGHKALKSKIESYSFEKVLNDYFSGSGF